MSIRTERRAEQRRNAKIVRKAARAAASNPTSQVPVLTSANNLETIPAVETPPSSPAPAPSAPTALAKSATEAKPTATAAQITANRDNSTHSTGPKTSAGKAAIGQNRRTHGLNYNAATFTVLPCEDQSDYHRLLHALQDDHKPADATESLLVINMAQHRWLFDRAIRLQESCFDPQTGQVSDVKLFSLYLRYATTHERAFHKCLNVLLNNRIQEQKRQIGFESQKRRAERQGTLPKPIETDNSHPQTPISGAESPAAFEIPAEGSRQPLQNAA